MPRTKTGVTRRHRHQAVLDHNKGYRGTNRRLYKRAHEAMLHADQYAYIGRKRRKRDFRKLWIMRINAALSEMGLQYSRFIKALNDANIKVDRKIMAELVVSAPHAFKAIVDKSGLTK